MVYDQLQLTFFFSQRYAWMLVRRCVRLRRSEWTRPSTIASTLGEEEERDARQY